MVMVRERRHTIWNGLSFIFLFFLANFILTGCLSSLRQANGASCYWLAKKYVFNSKIHVSKIYFTQFFFTINYYIWMKKKMTHGAHTIIMSNDCAFTHRCIHIRVEQNKIFKVIHPAEKQERLLPPFLLQNVHSKGKKQTNSNNSQQFSVKILETWWGSQGCVVKDQHQHLRLLTTRKDLFHKPKSHINFGRNQNSCWVKKVFEKVHYCWMNLIELANFIWC